MDNIPTGSIAEAESLIMAPPKEEPETTTETQEVVDEQPEVEEVEAADDAGEDVAEVEEVEETTEAETAEEHDEPESVDAEEAPQMFSVKVDGQMTDVTLDELLRGYSGQAYVQKGMHEASELKKESEAANIALQDELKAVQDLRKRLEQGEAVSKPIPPSKELFNNDPLGYMEAKMEYDEQVQKYEADQGRMNQISQAQQVQMRNAHQQHVQQQMEVLQKRIPEFADPERAPALREKLVKAAETYYGIPAEEIGQVSDARIISVLNDARKYREMRQAKQDVRPAKSKPKIKPGTARTEVSSQAKAREKAKARMKQTGSVDDIANFIRS